MYKSYKTELNPTEQQKTIIDSNLKLCIIAHNQYLDFNLQRINQRQLPRSAKAYLQMIRNEAIKDYWSCKFIDRKSEPAILYTLQNVEKTLNRFQQGKCNQPKRKKLGTKNISLHFTASSIHVARLYCCRHKIYIPFIGWVRLKEKGYIPYNDPNKIIVSGWIKREAGRYYVSALVKEPSRKTKTLQYTEGLGIDLNVNNFAYLSDGTVFENINKSEHIQKLKAKLKRETRSLSRMKNLNLNQASAKCMSERKNYHKQLHEIDLIYKRINNIQKDYVRKCIKTIVDKNPRFVAIEDLKVIDMVADSRFSKYISDELFYQFKIGLYHKCREKGIEFRVINKWIPTSKMCHECGSIKKELFLDEREFVCPSCGARMNRDYNASLNIRDASEYVVWYS